LETWVEETLEYAKKYSRAAKEAGQVSFFTISSTSKARQNLEPYLTPVRNSSNACIGGVVVFSLAHGLEIAKNIDGIMDFIVVEAENKLQLLDGEKKGNLSKLCFGEIEKSTFAEFKPNDITADSAWYTLSHHFEILSDRKVAIIGGGNIGFKLALKLVEADANVSFVRRNKEYGEKLAEALNLIKPSNTRANVTYQEDPRLASENADAIIGSSSGTKVIDAKMIRSMKKGGIVIDVGKGTITGDAIEAAYEAGIKVTRCDVSNGIIGAMEHLLLDQEAKSRFGRIELAPDVWIVSGGYMGQLGDIAVDDIRNHKNIIGVCNGIGDFKLDINANDELNLRYVRGTISEKGTS